MEKQKKVTVHHVLSLSYSLYLVGFLVGLVLELIFNFRVAQMPIPGFVLIGIGTIIIAWAQNTGANFRKCKSDGISASMFACGPYAFMRNPTQMGLTLLMLGFGFLSGASFIIITSCLSFVFVRFFVLRHEENILSSKYGEAYLAYKKSIKSWF